MTSRLAWAYKPRSCFKKQKLCVPVPCRITFIFSDSSFFSLSQNSSSLKSKPSQALVAHAYNPSYLGGWDWEDCGLRPLKENSSQDPVSKVTRVKWTGGMAQGVQHVFCKHGTLSSNPSPTKKIKVKNIRPFFIFVTLIQAHLVLWS
jgi:hypothetical protein